MSKMEFSDSLGYTGLREFYSSPKYIMNQAARKRLELKNDLFFEVIK